MIGLRFMDGAFAHYCLVSARYAAIIPDGMSYEQAATFSCAGVTVYAAIKRAGLKKGDFIAFSGLGALGGLGMEMAKRMVRFLIRSSLKFKLSEIDLVASQRMSGLNWHLQ